MGSRDGGGYQLISGMAAEYKMQLNQLILNNW